MSCNSTRSSPGGGVGGAVGGLWCGLSAMRGRALTQSTGEGASNAMLRPLCLTAWDSYARGWVAPRPSTSSPWPSAVPPTTTTTAHKHAHACTPHTHRHAHAHTNTHTRARMRRPPLPPPHALTHLTH